MLDSSFMSEVMPITYFFVMFFLLLPHEGISFTKVATGNQTWNRPITILHALIIDIFNCSAIDTMIDLFIKNSSN